jgi:predicted dehydrogenase
MINVALIGAGEHCLCNHGPALRLLADQRPGEIRLAAVYDLDPERGEYARATFGFDRAARSIDEAVGGDVRIDAIVTVVPAAAMLQVTQQLLPLGVPLMIEKPLGRHFQDAQQIHDMVQTAGVPVQVSLNRRYDPGLALALEWAQEQGAIRCIHGRMLRHNRTESDFLWGTGIHLLDALCSIAGPLTLGQVQAPSFAGNSARTGLLHGEGLASTFTILPACGRVDERLTLAGDGYCAEVRPGTHRPWRATAWRDGRIQWLREAPETEPEFIRTGALRETEAFLDAAITRSAPYPGVGDAMPATRLAAQLQDWHEQTVASDGRG